MNVRLCIVRSRTAVSCDPAVAGLGTPTTALVRQFDASLGEVEISGCAVGDDHMGTGAHGRELALSSHGWKCPARWSWEPR